MSESSDKNPEGKENKETVEPEEIEHSEDSGKNDNDQEQPEDLSISESHTRMIDEEELDSIESTDQGSDTLGESDDPDTPSDQLPVAKEEKPHQISSQIAEKSGDLLPTTEEKTWSSIAHVSIILNTFTIFLGPLVALIIYLIYKDKSRYIAYQSLQAFMFQLVFWVGAVIIASIMWFISLLLVLIIIGCCMIPIAFFLSLVPIAALIYGVIAAIETSQGKEFEYWIVGPWVRGILGDD